MICSVIANLSDNAAMAQQAIDAIADHGAFELGQVSNQSKLPLAIEAVDENKMNEITDWLSSLPGVSFVNVIFVYFAQHDCEGGGRLTI